MNAVPAGSPSRRSLPQRFAYALKPASWPKLVVPALLGQACGFASTGEASPAGLLAGMSFTFLLVSFIVLLNDWGDREVDAIKRRMFPLAGSEKTIPDGILPSWLVLTAGIFAGIAALGVAATAASTLDRPHAFSGGVLCLAVFVAYTLPPLKLNYRGGGELLEMAGTGVILPLYMAHLQGANALHTSMVVLPGWMMLCLASGIASGLSDEASDRRGGKRTVVTLVGNALSRKVIERLVALGAVLWLGVFGGGLVFWDADAVSLLGLLFAIGTLGLYYRRLVRISPEAISNAFRAQKMYKAALHSGMWRAALIMTLAIFLRA